MSFLTTVAKALMIIEFAYAPRSGSNTFSQDNAMAGPTSTSQRNDSQSLPYSLTIEIKDLNETNHGSTHSQNKAANSNII